MALNRIVFLIVATSVAASLATGTVIAQNPLEPSHIDSSLARVLIVGSARTTWGPFSYRHISVFVEPHEFTIENLRAVFLSLSEEYLIGDDLKITAFSDRRRISAEAK